MNIKGRAMSSTHVLESSELNNLLECHWYVANEHISDVISPVMWSDIKNHAYGHWISSWILNGTFEIVWVWFMVQISVNMYSHLPVLCTLWFLCTKSFQDFIQSKYVILRLHIWGLMYFTYYLVGLEPLGTVPGCWVSIFGKTATWAKMYFVPCDREMIFTADVFTSNCSPVHIEDVSLRV